MKVGPTDVTIQRGLDAGVLPKRPGRRRVAILTQPEVGRGPSRLAEEMNDNGLIAEVFDLPDREAAKTLDVAAEIYERLAGLGLGREDTVVGFGGGSVTDTAGFVAGTWLRGVEVVHLPTTLLGAVDASIGGKAGVNLGGKNLVGVFWHPSRVVIDLDILEALPGGLLLEGMAEVLKAGLIGDVDLVELIEDYGTAAPLEVVVPAAIQVKAAYVVDDPHEKGERAMLNYGHTIGHAVEFASAMSHGFAVGVGMVAAAAVSRHLLGFSDERRVIDVIHRLGLPVTVGSLDRDRISDLLLQDKKRDGQGLRMVLLEALGRPVLRHVDRSSIDLGLQAIGL